MKKITVVIPTYNERKNIPVLINEILSLKINADIKILVVDDNSPDLTWKIVEEIEKNNSRVKLIKRTGKRGRGLAGIYGFKWACREKTDYIIEMDADFSHHPQYIPLLLEEVKNADMVIASRFISGGKDKERSIVRKFISRLASFIIRNLWRINICDPQAGYRCYKREVIEDIISAKLISKDQFLLLEMLYRICKNGYKVKEIPIIFYNRKYGHSKLKVIDLFNCFRNVLKFAFRI